MHGDSIWIVTGDLEEDVNNPEILKIIGDNLKKGVQYEYFISKVNGVTTPTAKAGVDKLKNKYTQFVNKSLFFYYIDCELIVPDIDIIIYKSNSADNKEGYACIELGNDESTYTYQMIEKSPLISICDKLAVCAGVSKSVKTSETRYVSSQELQSQTYFNVFGFIWTGIHTILSVVAIN